MLGSVGLVQEACAETLLVGTAKLDLTPPIKTPLAGYSRRKGKPATGIHDPLFVRAIVMQDGTTTVALASCDVLIIDERLFEAVKHRLEAAQPQTLFTLLIAATHTHSGPGAYGQKFLEKVSMGHFNRAVFDFLSTRISQAILTASAQMQPVTIQSTTVSTTGLVANRMSRAGAVDPELTCLAFYDEHHHPVAVVVNFAAHPTTLGAWNRALSADYPGVLTRTVEERYPPAICAFVAGAVGDQAPMKQGSGFESAQRFGNELAQRLFPLIDQSSDHRISRVLVDQRVLRLPPAHLHRGSLQFPRWLSQPLVDDDATLTAILMDPVLLIGVPCDLSAELGLELKRYVRARNYQPLLIGFANDYIGYCVPEHLYWTDSYEASMAFNGPKAGEMVVKELETMIDGFGTR